MKNQFYLAFAAILVPSFVQGQAQEDYINWVRQIQTEVAPDGSSFEVVQDLFVETRGAGSSALNIPEGGAIFQLWTMNSITQESWLLDTDVVGSTRLKSQLSIDSVDSHAGVARTRVDLPFTVTIDYLNLQEQGEGVDEGLTQVRSYNFTEGLENSGKDTITSSTEVSIVSNDGLSSFNAVGEIVQTNLNGASNILSFGYDRIVQENGREVLSDRFAQIPAKEGQDPLKIIGIETFVVEMATGAEEEVVLASERIEVYPVPDGSLTGIDSETIKFLPDQLTATINDAYPGSHISVEVNIQSEGAEANEDWIELFSTNISEENSQDLEVVFTEWEIIGELENGDRLEFRLVSETPFTNGDELVEILSESTTTYDNELILRGSINSFDK